MTDIDWSVLKPVNAGNAFMEGFQNGRRIKREAQQQSALDAYAANPGEQSMNALLPFMPPNQAFNVIQQRQQAQATKQQEQSEHLGKAVGQAVLDVMRRPPEQRAQAWDSYVDHFSQTNPEAAKYKGQYNEQAAMAVLAEQGLMSDYQKQSAPPKTAMQQNYEFLNGVNPQYGNQYIQRQVSEPPMVSSNGDGTFTVIPRSQMQGGASSGPTASAIDYLRKNPALKVQFEAKYGRGAASQYLGGPASSAPAHFPGN